MDSYNKASVIHSSIWGTVVLVVLVFFIFSLSSCVKDQENKTAARVKDQENKTAALKTECIQKGNAVIPTSAQYQFICIKTVEEKK